VRYFTGVNSPSLPAPTLMLYVMRVRHESFLMALRVSGRVAFCGGVQADILEMIMKKNTSSRLFFGLTVTPLVVLARIFHELLS
jgi:hypothetical protein